MQNNSVVNEVAVLQRVFSILTVCGCWQPRRWSSTWKKMLYNIYTFVVFLVVYGLTVSQFLDIVFNVENQDDFSETFYFFLAMFVAVCKMNTLLLSRTNIGVLMDTLEEAPYVPENSEEFAIRKRFDDMTQSHTNGYLTLIETTITCMTVSSLFTKFSDRELVFRAWLPYDYTSLISYTLTFIHQIIALIAGALMTVSCDGLLCGLLVHTCCQMEILGYRLRQIKKDDIDSVKACARHHANIYRFAVMVNKEFKTIILLQFMVSTLVVCFNLYIIASSDGITSQAVQLIMFTGCILTQIFLYCWFGNEVKTKSLEVVDSMYEVEWTHLKFEAKKILLISMQRAMVPIEFTSAYVFSMNLESFMNILKTAYSAFNVLQQAQNQ